LTTARFARRPDSPPKKKQIFRTVNKPSRPLPVSLPDTASSVRPSRRSFVKAVAALPLVGAFGPFNIHIRAADSNSPFATDNEVITRARNAALAILKPTAKQIDQGFKIHAEALVFESYGFAPRAALDGDRFQAAVASGASDRELVDLRGNVG
jgi:membrane dipeptidase